MTFDELFKHHDLAPNEREQLVVYLATYRAMATLKALAAPTQGAETK